MFLLGLGAESRDQVGRDRAVGQDAADRLDSAEIPFARVLAVHQFQYPGVARLGGQVNGAADVRMSGHRVEQFVAQVLGVGGREAHPQQRIDGSHLLEQAREVGRLPVALPAVRVDVLAEQRHLAVARAEQFSYLAHDRLRVARTLGSPGVGHHAVRAHVVTAAHDRHESADAVAVEPHGRDLGIGLLLRQQHVDRPGSVARLPEEAGQVAVGVRSRHDVDRTVALEQSLLEPLGHATQYADPYAGLFSLERAQFAQPGPNALFRVVADRAGVQQNHVGFFDALGVTVAFVLEDRKHDFAVACVHLAAVSFDIELAAVARERTERAEILWAEFHRVVVIFFRGTP